LVLLVALILGSAATALLVVVAHGLVSPINVTAREISFAVVAFGALVVQVVRPSLRVPKIDRQIPEIVFAKGSTASAAQFGFELGLGWRTQLTTLSIQVLSLGLVLLPIGIATTFVVFLGFGLGRFLHFVVRLLSGDGYSWDAVLSRGFSMQSAAIAGIVVFLIVAIPDAASWQLA
jgi:hypothetical protein